MACVELSLIPGDPAALTVGAVPEAGVAVANAGQATVVLAAGQQAGVVVSVAAQAVLETVPAAAELTIGEVCTVSGGSVVVLAASDGPLRTRNGGYLLLNPATNPPED